MKEINNIVLIGAGNVATSLSMALHQAGKKIIQVISRHTNTARELAEKVDASFSTSIEEIKTTADIIICAVSDHALKEITENLKIKDTLIVHTSGSVALDIFENKYTDYGVFYPLQTFTKSTPITLNNVPVCIEANNQKTLKILRELGHLISNNVADINSDERKYLHLAAVFACNYTNFMYAIAEDLLKDHGLDMKILHPLIEETASKAIKYRPSEVQTGPAKRNDINTISRHLEILSNQRDYQEIYKVLSDKIRNKYKPNEF